MSTSLETIDIHTFHDAHRTLHNDNMPLSLVFCEITIHHTFHLLLNNTQLTAASFKSVMFKLFHLLTK